VSIGQPMHMLHGCHAFIELKASLEIASNFETLKIF